MPGEAAGDGSHIWTTVIFALIVKTHNGIPGSDLTTVCTWGVGYQIEDLCLSSFSVAMILKYINESIHLFLKKKTYNLGSLKTNVHSGISFCSTVF